MKDSFRLSRISQPRATLAAIVLIATVFVAFGVFADQALPSAGESTRICADVEFGHAWLLIKTLLDIGTP